MPTTFIKVPKRTDCFTHFPKLTYLHMHRNMHVRFSVSQQSEVNIPSAPIKGRDTQKLTTDLHKNTVPTPAVSEGCTFLNAEARKNTQNTTHIDMETQLQKAQLNFHHLHQKTQWRRLVTYPGGSNSSSSVPNCSISTSDSQALLSVPGLLFCFYLVQRLFSPQ